MSNIALDELHTEGVFDFHPYKPEMSRAEDAQDNLQKRLTTALPLFTIAHDSGRQGAIVALRAVIDYFGEQAPDLAAGGFLNPIKQVADALVGLDRGLVSRILQKPAGKIAESKISPDELVFRGVASAMVDAWMKRPDPARTVRDACARVARALIGIGYQIGRTESDSAGVIENWRKAASGGNSKTDVDAHFYSDLKSKLDGSTKASQMLMNEAVLYLPGIFPPSNTR